MSIYFYSTTDDFGFFSNFSPHGFELDGKYWPTVEHSPTSRKYVCNRDTYHQDRGDSDGAGQEPDKEINRIKNIPSRFELSLSNLSDEG